MGRREPCICCGKDPIEADGGNLCRACVRHGGTLFGPHPVVAPPSGGMPAKRVEPS